MTHQPSLSSTFVRDLYARMLLTRIVDEHVCQLCELGHVLLNERCYGQEAAQVGSAICIEVGQDFTLPYYRDLGVVLTIGMTPYEVFRTHLNTRLSIRRHDTESSQLHWAYHKHNMVASSATVATQILHAAGIAFASKLRKVPVVTVAYCDDETVAEQDFLEGIRFAAQHQLPVIFICEQHCQHDPMNTPSCIQDGVLPEGLTHLRIDGTDVMQVYTTMDAAVQQIRTGHGPILLEMALTRSSSAPHEYLQAHDPLLRCQQFLQAHDMWDETWAAQLHERIRAEVEQAMQSALYNTQFSSDEDKQPH